MVDSDARTTAAAAEEASWFAGRQLDVLVFKINRRPARAEKLAPFQPPEDLFEHLRSVLSEPTVVKSGRKNQRDWRLGNLEFDDENRIIQGRVGWTRETSAKIDTWDEETQSYAESEKPKTDSAVTPIVILADSELVGVLRHPSFTTEHTVNEVVAKMMNTGQGETDKSNLVWNVDPVGDRALFDDWLETVDQLLTLTVTVKRPNPDNEAEFQAVEDRLNALQAEQETQKLVARDDSVGLDRDAIRADVTLKGMIQAALRSYGSIKGKGRRADKPDSFDQEKNGNLRETIDSVGDDWATATENVLEALRKAKDRRQDGEAKA